MYIPRFIPYTPDEKIDDVNKLTISGANFDPSFTYYWAFKYGLSTIKEVLAEYIDATSVKCRPIDYETEAYIDLQIKVVYGSISSFAYGTINIYFYELPTVQKIFPTFSAYDQEEEVGVTIDYLPFIHTVYCKFGDDSATVVTVYRQGKQIICKAPVILSANPSESVTVKVSVDNQHWYESEQYITFFSPPTFTGVDNTDLPLFGRSYIEVVGTNFYDTGNLMVWRFKISANEYYDLKVEFVSSTSIKCLNPPQYMAPISGMELSVSFNRLKFYTVASNLEYKDVPRVYSIDKKYGSETPVSNTITVTGEGFTGATLVSVGGFKDDVVFTPSSDTVGTFDLPEFINISAISGRPYTYQCYFDLEEDISKYCTDLYSNGQMAWCFLGSSSMVSYNYLISKEDYGWVWLDRYPKSSIEAGIPSLEYSRNGVSFQYYPLPEIKSLDPQAIFKDTTAVILVRGEGFWNTNSLQCRLRTTTGSVETFSFLTTTFINTTTIKWDFPSVSDISSTYEIGVTLNGYEFTKEADELILFVNDPLNVYSVYPTVMFKNSENVEILVRAEPLNSLLTYFCIVHEFNIEGVIHTDSGGLTYIKCVIPSYEAIANSAVNPISSNGEVEIRLTSGGVIFTGGVTFRFLDQDQVNGISPLNGPDIGGTTITITLTIDQTSGNIGDVYWLFHNTISVLATASPPFDFLCVTPALNVTLWELSTFDWDPIFTSS